MSTDKQTTQTDSSNNDDKDKYRTYLLAGLAAIVLLAAVTFVMIPSADNDDPAPNPPEEAPPEPTETATPTETPTTEEPTTVEPQESMCNPNGTGIADPGETTYEDTSSSAVSQNIATQFNEWRANNNATQLDVNENVSALARQHHVATMNNESFTSPAGCNVKPLYAVGGDLDNVDSDRIITDYIETMKMSDDEYFQKLREDAMKEKWDSIGVGTYITDNGDLRTMIFLVDEDQS